MTSAETRQQRRQQKRRERKAQRYAPVPKNAFARVIGVLKQRAEALTAAATMGPITAKLALMNLALKLGEYKSRGHGRGTPSRRYGNRPGAYMPHQGAREMERRRMGGFCNRRSLRYAVFA